MHGWHTAHTHAALSVTWCLPLQKSSGRFHITAGWSLLLGFLNKEMSAGIKSTSTNLGEIPHKLNHTFMSWIIAATNVDSMIQHAPHTIVFCHFAICISCHWLLLRLLLQPTLMGAAKDLRDPSPGTSVLPHCQKEGPNRWVNAKHVKRWLAHTHTHFYRLRSIPVYLLQYLLYGIWPKKCVAYMPIIMNR